MNPSWKQALALLALVSGIPPSAAAAPTDPSVKRFVAEELALDGERSDAACLSMPVFLTYDADCVYVVDAQDCAVKIFSKQGRFKAAVGRRGQGPAEFQFPSGVSVVGGRLFVADKLNHRIQVLDASGRYRRSFVVPFAPDRVFVLAADRVLVTHHASGRSGPEKLLHVFSTDGELLREELVSRASGDAVFDAFCNMFLVNPGPHGDFFLVFKSQDRSILHYGRDGSPLGRIPVDRRYGFKTLALPPNGMGRRLDAFCWDSAYDRGCFYFLAPELTNENDIGPGNEVYVFAGDGRLEALIALPERVSRLAVDGDRIYAVNRASELKIFRITR
jgi:hypothetical protein